MPKAVHETLELSELAVFKSTCLTKSKTMQVLVSDEQLKAILQQDVAKSTRHLQELQGLLAT